METNFEKPLDAEIAKKQNSTDNNLSTTAKTVVGAINENASAITSNSTAIAKLLIDSPGSVLDIINALPTTGMTALLSCGSPVSTELGASGALSGIAKRATSSRIDYFVSKQNGSMWTGNITITGTNTYTVSKYEFDANETTATTSGLTASSNVTIVSHRLIKTGNIVQIDAHIQYTGTYQSAASYIELCTINDSKYRPSSDIISMQEDNSSSAEAYGSSCMMNFGSSGAIKVYKPASSSGSLGKDFLIHLVYLKY